MASSAAFFASFGLAAKPCPVTVGGEPAARMTSNSAWLTPHALGSMDPSRIAVSEIVPSRKLNFIALSALIFFDKAIISRAGGKGGVLAGIKGLGAERFEARREYGLGVGGGSAMFKGRGVLRRRGFVRAGWRTMRCAGFRGGNGLWRGMRV